MRMEEDAARPGTTLCPVMELASEALLTRAITAMDPTVIPQAALIRTAFSCWGQAHKR